MLLPCFIPFPFLSLFRSFAHFFISYPQEKEMKKKKKTPYALMCFSCMHVLYISPAPSFPLILSWSSVYYDKYWLVGCASWLGFIRLFQKNLVCLVLRPGLCFICQVERWPKHMHGWCVCGLANLEAGRAAQKCSFQKVASVYAMGSVRCLCLSIRTCKQDAA